MSGKQSKNTGKGIDKNIDKNADKNADKTYRMLFLGDIMGRCGRNAVEKKLADLQWEHNVDITILNGENTCHGRGLNRRYFRFYKELGVDVVTLGNHMWDNGDIMPLMQNEDTLCRPANLPPGMPGRDYVVVPCGDIKVAVVNLIGRVNMNVPAVDCPFQTMQRLLPEIQAITPVIMVDFHAETTSEKLALGNFLDGRVTAFWGTHTHVQTNDARLLPRGTAYLTDAGMTGPLDSILGMDTATVVRRYITGQPVSMHPAEGTAQINGLVVEFAADGRAQNIKLINETIRL